MRGYVSVNVDVDVDYDEIIYSMSNKEKQEMYERLKEELGYDNNVVGTTGEQELFDICNKIYENRNSLTNEDRVLLSKFSIKGWYDKVV